MILVAKPFYFSLPRFCIQHFLSHFHITWSSQKAWIAFWLFVCVPSQAPWQELRMEIYTLRTHDLIFMSVCLHRQFDTQREVLAMQTMRMGNNLIGQKDSRLRWEQHRDWHICMKGVKPV
jgi:hypothetical protein